MVAQRAQLAEDGHVHGRPERRLQLGHGRYPLAEQQRGKRGRITVFRSHMLEMPLHGVYSNIMRLVPATARDLLLPLTGNARNG